MKRLPQILAYLTIFALISSCGPGSSKTPLANPTTPPPPPTVTPTSPPPVTKLSISPGKETEGDFISLLLGGDGDTEVVEACQVAGLRATGNGQALPADPSNAIGDSYMQFDVDNEVLFGGKPTSRIQLDIEYCDQGTDSFMVEYDGLSGGPYGDGKFKTSELVVKTDSGPIQTASFTFNDANFSNRDNGADFRISDMGDGAEAILSVTITLNPTVASGTLTPTALPTRSAPAVDATTLNKKVIFGYQGWFACPQDDSLLNVWEHWFPFGTQPTADNLKVDLWPDISELGEDELCPTNMSLPNGAPLMAYSAYNETTVMRHFQWMEEYGIDGVALQRFTCGLQDPKFLDFRNRVARNVKLGAETFGRVFYIEYAVSGCDSPSALLSQIKSDWEYLVDRMQLADSPQYLHEGGLPVVEIWGMGVVDNLNISAAQAQAIIDYFQRDADPRYRAVVIGGEGSYWRKGFGDAYAGAEWAAVFRSYDVINPWAVGRYSTNSEADVYLSQVIQPDLRETQNLGMGYMPVIFPGFSWKNMFDDSPSNQIPRRCGEFYWHQAYNAVKSGASMIFVAMFDEVDEGTAMYKLAPTQAELPVGANLIPLNMDGCNLPSDWYLQLGGLTGKMLRGEIPLSADMPIAPP